LRGTDNEYAPLNAPWIRTKIRRNLWIIYYCLSPY